MAPRPTTLERSLEPTDAASVAVAVAGTPPFERERARGSFALFVAGSCVAHAVAWVVLAALPSEPFDLLAESAMLDFSVVEEPLPSLPEPEPAPEVEPEPPPTPAVAPPPPPPPEPRQEDTPPPPAPLDAPPPETADETPPTPGLPASDNVGVTSTEGGLAVNAVEGGGGSGPLTLQRGAHVGPGAADVQATEPTIDHRRLAREWMAEVNRVVLTRAIRDYPRAARRAHLEGTVVVSISVAPDGRITGVSVAQGAGNDTLDRAALAAVEAVGTLPRPPDIFNRRGRPLTMPIRYRFE